MIRWLCALILLVLCWFRSGTAQEGSGDRPPFDADSGVERLFEGEIRDEEDIDLADMVGQLEREPLDLNEAHIEDFESIPGLSPFLARGIVLQRNQLDGFRSVDDLLAVPGMSVEVFRSIRPFVVVLDSSVRGTSLKNLWKNVSARARIRSTNDLQTKRGFQDGTYRGSKPKIYQRLTVSYQRRSEAGLLLEKDQGERKANDYMSMYLRFRDLPIFSDLILGDYQIEVGEGVALWGASGISRGGDPVAFAKKSSRGIIPHRSVEENRFFRGLAGTFEVGNIELTGFYSRNARDANVKGDTVVGFPTTGYHRTLNEMSQRKTAQEKMVGGRIVYRFTEQAHVGVTAYTADFDKLIFADNPYRVPVQRSRVIGVDFESSGETVSVFGEWAHNRSGAFGGVSGVVLWFEPFAAVSFLVRSNPKTLLSAHGSVAHRGGREAKNEWGVYSGLRVRPTNDVVLSGYFDLVRTRWTGLRSPFPGWGYESFLQADFHPRNYIRLSVRYDFDSQVDTHPAIDDNGLEFRSLVSRWKRNVRVTFIYEIGRQFVVRGRAEMVEVGCTGTSSIERGMLLYHQIKYRPDRRTTLEARVIFFDTDSFDSRVYEFENDVRGVFATPALFGRGMRWYALVRLKIAAFLGVSAKYAETYRDDVKTMGSGADAIARNVRSRLNIQLDISLH